MSQEPAPTPAETSAPQKPIMPLEQQDGTAGSTNRRRSSWRSRFVVDKVVKLTTSSVEVIGQENLQKLPPDAKPIFATTHIKDIDIPIVANAVAGDFDLMIGDISQHRNFREDPKTYALLTLAGRKMFAPIDYHRNPQGQWEAGHFNHENLEPMAQALKEGKAAVLAAHNPSNEGKMVNNPGYGVVYLASMVENGWIIPAAVDVQSEIPIDNKGEQPKPKAVVKFGVPYKPTKIDVAAREAVLKKRASGQKLDKKDLEVLNTTRYQLKEEARRLMTILASMTPEGKRGIWANPAPNTGTPPLG